MKKTILSLLAAAIVCLVACAQKQKAPEATSATGKKVLVTYFSATGTTEQVARQLAEVTGGDLFAITPAEAYTDADLDWRNDQSRSSVEMHNLTFRPALKSTKADIEQYDVIYVGFPIWWDLAPTIVNTFIESHKLDGKKVVPFATSGGSTIDNSQEQLRKAYPGIDWQDGALLNHPDKETLRQWTAKH